MGNGEFEWMDVLGDKAREAADQISADRLARPGRSATVRRRLPATDQDRAGVIRLRRRLARAIPLPELQHEVDLAPIQEHRRLATNHSGSDATASVLVAAT